MTRLNAALLAGVVTVLLFAAVFTLVDWLTGRAGFSHVIESPLFVVGVIAFNIVALVLLAIWSRRRAKREERDEPPTPPIRRPPSPGPRGL
jgi:membrane protein implicated in regulation of membrane protease activity